MVASTEHKVYKKLMKNGDGSVLKAIRADKGCGKGIIAGAITLLVFSLMIVIPCIMIGEYIIAAAFVIPCILLIILGNVLHNRRKASWLSYYQEMSGFTENELKQIDRELSSASVRVVICKSPGAATENFPFCFVTENYMLINGVYPYLKRLEDVIALAFSDSTDNWCMASITKQDKETMAIKLFTDTGKKEALCNEVMQELRRANPNIICGQDILCEGKHYILERDGAELIRLYNEGRTLESVK